MSTENTGVPEVTQVHVASSPIMNEGTETTRPSPSSSPTSGDQHSSPPPPPPALQQQQQYASGVFPQQQQQSQGSFLLFHHPQQQQQQFQQPVYHQPQQQQRPVPLFGQQFFQQQQQQQQPVAVFQQPQQQQQGTNLFFVPNAQAAPPQPVVMGEPSPAFPSSPHFGPSSPKANDNNTSSSSPTNPTVINMPNQSQHDDANSKKQKADNDDVHNAKKNEEEEEEEKKRSFESWQIALLVLPYFLGVILFVAFFLGHFALRIGVFVLAICGGICGSCVKEPTKVTYASNLSGEQIDDVRNRECGRLLCEVGICLIGLAFSITFFVYGAFSFIACSLFLFFSLHLAGCLFGRRIEYKLRENFAENLYFPFNMFCTCFETPPQRIHYSSSW